MINFQKIRIQGNFYNLIVGIEHTVTISAALPQKERVSVATSHITIKPEVPYSAIKKEKSKGVLKT